MAGSFTRGSPTSDRLVELVVVCRQGEFDCNEQPMLLKQREKAVIKG